MNTVGKRPNLTPGLAVVSALILLSACGGTAAAPASAGSATTASSAQSPVFRGTTTQRVGAWFVDGGHAELTRLITALDAVGHASTLAAQGAACTKLAAAVTSARADPQVPDAAARASFTSALAEYAASAVDCKAGASSHNVALMNKAADATRIGNGDILRFDTETKDAQTKEVQREEAAKCKQLYQAWQGGPARAALSQFLPALAALQETDSGQDLTAITAAAEKAAQPAGQLARYPVPACADAAGYFAQILDTVVTAAATAGAAANQSVLMEALAPLKGVPALEAEFTAEVKTATSI